MTTTLPSTGTTWKQGGFAEVDNRFNARGGLAAILVRDNRGIATNISPWTSGSPPTINWAPAALDGKLRGDLFAALRDPDTGVWAPNPDPNEGWWLIGALDDKGGPDRKANIKHDDQMILQSNFPFDSDLTGEGLTIQFTPVEVIKDLIRRLRMNLPLSDSSGNPIVSYPGATNYVVSKPVDAETVDRQIGLMFARRKAGTYVYTVEAYPLCKLTDIGNFKRDKTSPDAASLTYTVLPDPYHVDKDASDPTSEELIPALYSEFVFGDGWLSMGGAPVFPGLAPFAAGTSSTTAVVQFREAVAPGTVTYTAEKKISTTWSAATVGTVDLDEPTEGDVTLHITGLSSGAQKFRVTATVGSQHTVSQESNSVTLA